jgi:hypothetical protein
MNLGGYYGMGGMVVSPEVQLLKQEIANLKHDLIRHMDALNIYIGDKQFKINISDQWKPIESAPKDGTVVLLFLPDCNRKINIGQFRDTGDVEYGKVIRERKYWMVDGWFTVGADPVPTHWMPLPEPPKEKEDESTQSL